MIRRLLRLWVIAVLAIVLVLALCLGLALRDRGLVFPGVRIAGRSAGGMTRPAVLDEARSLVPSGEVRLALGKLSWQRKPSELGLRFFPERAARKAWLAGRTGSWPRRMMQRAVLRLSPLDLPIPSQFDRRLCREALSAIAGSMLAGPKNATAVLASDRVKIEPGQAAVKLDLDASEERIERWAAGDTKGPIELQGSIEEPSLTADDLREVTSVIATFSTGLGSSSSARRHNVKLAAEAISGTVLKPGEVFSFNQVVGPRTEEAGYRTAPVLQHGLLVPGTGGGACQVSSTLYNAALLANLEIVKRYHHSQPVAYLAAGRDATVWYGTFDLKFRNPGDSPIVLHASVGRRRLAFSVLGKPMPAPVRVYSWRKAGKAAPAVVKLDPTLPPGKKVAERSGKRAVMAVTVREVGEGPEAVRETISRDYYGAVAAVIRAGPAGEAQPEAPAAGPQPTPAPRPEREPEGPAAPDEAAGQPPAGLGQFFPRGPLAVLTAFGDLGYNTIAAGA